jgi:hypothetical protein
LALKEYAVETALKSTEQCSQLCHDFVAIYNFDSYQNFLNAIPKSENDYTQKNQAT